MKQTLTIVQILLSILVSTLILLQAKGTGLGRAFGQGTYHSKRGVEFVVFRMTIVAAIVFVIVSIVIQLI